MIPARKEPGEILTLKAADLVKGSLRLVALPETCARLTSLVDDPRSTGAMVAQVIGTDPGLCARLLRIANSPFYGFPSRIDTLERAVTVIGMHALRDLVLASSVIRIISRIGIVDMRPFWRHSLICGLASRALGARCGATRLESLFVAGLLHDIGQVIILMKLPEIAREMRVRAIDCDVPLYELERAVLGFDHADVGAELLRQWLLPESLWQAVKYHHGPMTRHPTLGASIVQAADVIAHLFIEPLPAGDPSPEIVTERITTPLRALLALDAADLLDLRREVLAQFQGLGDELLAAA
jgi:putative nucleotidyltransferase with HDIG domain